jgi:hypothetical protein
VFEWPIDALPTEGIVEISRSSAEKRLLDL